MTVKPTVSTDGETFRTRRASEGGANERQPATERTSIEGENSIRDVKIRAKHG